jgi:hypothetical protein
MIAPQVMNVIYAPYTEYSKHVNHLSKPLNIDKLCAGPITVNVFIDYSTMSLKYRGLVWPKFLEILSKPPAYQSMSENKKEREALSE